MWWDPLVLAQCHATPSVGTNFKTNQIERHSCEESTCTPSCDGCECLGVRVGVCSHIYAHQYIVRRCEGLGFRTSFNSTVADVVAVVRCCELLVVWLGTAAAQRLTSGLVGWGSVANLHILNVRAYRPNRESGFSGARTAPETSDKLSYAVR